MSWAVFSEYGRYSVLDSSCERISAREDVVVTVYTWHATG